MRNLLYFIPNSIHLENIFEYYKREREKSLSMVEVILKSVST